MALTLAFNSLQSQKKMTFYRLESFFSGQEQVMMSQRTQTLFLAPTSVRTQPLKITRASDALFWRLCVPVLISLYPCHIHTLHTCKTLLKTNLLNLERWIGSQEHWLVLRGLGRFLTTILWLKSSVTPVLQDTIPFSGLCGF